ncbi:hypothetical protein HYW46_04870 [Candidatus Daviesbacteria bacterium]|nr:hypothetical protein [Candidatus Daviesbacteria bacterium]
MIESQPVDLSKIIIARKWSYIEWNMHHSNLTMEEFIKNQKSLGIKTDAMTESHYKQQASLEKILGLFERKPKVLIGETLTKKLLSTASLVISLGGDDHLKYVSHFIGDQLALPLNSDYERSEGGMISYLPEDFKRLLPKLKKGDYEIEECQDYKLPYSTPTVRL